jgi:hypothetical protein
MSLKRLPILLVVGGALAAFGAGGAAAQEPPAQQDKDNPASITVPLPTGTKLFLKDGSFHMVRSYEVKGDRVRYWSVERSAWEEIPTQIVDWDATHAGEAAAAAKRKEIDATIRALEQKQIAAEVDADASLEIAPGVFLPEGIGLFVLEGKNIAALSQSQAESKLSKGRFFAQKIVPIPVIPTQHKVKLDGARAVLRISAAEPEFYFRTADGREPNVQLIRAKVKGKVRELGAINTNIAGESKANINGVALERWQAAKGVYRFTLGQSLEPGEYAFVEFTDNEGMNLYVWDFGVEPVSSAPAAKK